MKSLFQVSEQTKTDKLVKYDHTLWAKVTENIT